MKKESTTNTWYVKKILFGTARVTLILGMLANTYSFGRSFRPPAGYTGAPPTFMTCSACHGESGNGSLSLVFNNGEEKYKPGETYSIEVAIQDQGQSRFGFSMASRITATPENPTGTWIAGDNSTVLTGNQYIGHSNAPFADNNFTFQMMWTAPNEDVGDITFYGVGNAANGNGTNDAGDNIYTKQLVIQPFTEPANFWSNSPQLNGWRFTGEAYPELVGIGLIYDAHWPWYFTYDHDSDAEGDWIYIFTSEGNAEEYYAYNFSESYYFYAVAKAGWYYSFEPGATGWYPMDF